MVDEGAAETTTAAAASIIPLPSNGEEAINPTKSTDSSKGKLDAETRRQMVVSMAKNRVSINKKCNNNKKEAAGIISDSNASTTTGPTYASDLPPALATGSAAGVSVETSTEGASKATGISNTSSAATNSPTYASDLPPALASISTGIPVETSVEEVKAKIMMSYDSEDDDDGKDDAEEKENKKEESAIVINSDQSDDVEEEDPTIVINNAAPSTELKIGVQHADIRNNNNSDIPFDERPTELPDDMPSFDAGDSWAGATRPVSTPPPAPKNCLTKNKHFFGGPEQSATKPQDETAAMQKDRSSSEDTDAAAAAASVSCSFWNDNSSGQHKSIDKAPRTDKEKSTSFVEKEVPRAVSTSFEESGEDVVAPPRETTKSTKQIAAVKASRVSVSTDDDEGNSIVEASIGRERGGRHHARSSGRRRSSGKRKKRNQSLRSIETYDSSFYTDERTMSVAETSVGLMDKIGNCVPANKRSLILEFDQDLFGWMRCHSQKVNNVTFDDDEVSDISSLTGKWRRSKEMVEAQRKAKAASANAEQEMKDREARHNLFDWMLMICGDLKSMVSEGVGGHRGEGAGVSGKGKKGEAARAEQASF